MLRAGNESIETIFAVYERESTLWKMQMLFINQQIGQKWNVDLLTGLT